MAKQNTPKSQSTTGSSYPLNTLEQALRLGKIVLECGGGSSPVHRSVIAAKAKQDDSSSAFYAQIASAKTFGVLAGASDVSLTEAAKDYFHPTSDNAKRKAELSFFNAPGAFRYLIAKFDGGFLPTPDVVKNNLLRDKVVPGSWAPRTATLFRGTAESLGLVDSAGHLRFKASSLSVNGNPGLFAEEDGDDESPDSSDSSSASRSSLMSSNSESFERLRPAHQVGASEHRQSSGPPAVDPTKTVWIVAGGKVRLETPNPMTRQMWEKLTKYVELLEPTEENEEG